MRTALVLEEIPEMRSLFRVLLSRVGVQALEACTAQQAVEAVIENPGLVLLIATQQPGDEGRRHIIGTLVRRNPGMAVVITSGYMLKPRELPRGAMFLQKPFHPNEIMQELARLVLRSQ